MKVNVLIIIANGCLRECKCRQEKTTDNELYHWLPPLRTWLYETYTVVFSFFSALDLVCLIVLHQSLHEVLGPLSSRIITAQIRQRRGQSSIWRARRCWRNLTNLLYLTCRQKKSKQNNEGIFKKCISFEILYINYILKAVIWTAYNLDIFHKIHANSVSVLLLHSIPSWIYLEF